MDSPQSGEATQYALRVALQTMKERCQDLQKRLAQALEDENHKLRQSDKTEMKPSSTLTNAASVGFAAENFQLRLQLAELQRLKTQLTEQVNMVSTENRKLWSRLSQMAKDQGKSNTERDQDCTITNKDSGRNGVNGANQNLIRSKTFTQHSPNPNLRLKQIDNATTTDVKDLSLEEVPLNIGAGEELATVGDSELGFSYLNIDDSHYVESNNVSEADFQQETKKCDDGLQDLRREALQQQQELHIALTTLQLRIAKPPCLECAKKSNKPEMADKSLETDESLNEVLQESQLIATPTSHNINETTSAATTRINFIEELVQATPIVKRCPMCGKTYTEATTFQKFCEHVESHFSFETSDCGSMLEDDFESISNTIGNF